MAHTMFIFFLICIAGLSTFTAQGKQCDYLITVNTGPTRGPTSKLSAAIEAVSGENINTTNLVKNWGAMGKGHTYFLPNSSDRFKYRGHCTKSNFCNIGFRGKKGELKPHWYINNITVATKGKGIDRLMEFFISGQEFAYTYVDEGDCPT